MPVIGFLDPALPDTFADHRRAFQLGLKEAGYVEGDNVAVSYRGPRINPIDYPSSRTIWFVGRSP